MAPKCSPDYSLPSYKLLLGSGSHSVDCTAAVDQLDVGLHQDNTFMGVIASDHSSAINIVNTGHAGGVCSADQDLHIIWF